MLRQNDTVTKLLLFYFHILRCSFFLTAEQKCTEVYRSVQSELNFMSPMRFVGHFKAYKVFLSLCVSIRCSAAVIYGVDFFRFISAQIPRMV